MKTILLTGFEPFGGDIVNPSCKGNLPKAPPSVPALWALTHRDPFLPQFGRVIILPD